MRKIYLAASMMAIFALMLAATPVKAQYSTTFYVNVNPYMFDPAWTYLPGVNPLFGEAIYKDLGLPAAAIPKVGAGDIRLTPVFDLNTATWYPAGSTVGASDFDVGNNLYGKTAAQWSIGTAVVRHRDTGATPSRYDYKELIYLDADNNGAVSVGDTRFSNVTGYKVGSVVANLDVDIGGSLVVFAGNLAAAYERYTDNLESGTTYDYARFYVDIGWNTNLPDISPEGMRGWQATVRVDPNVLTPNGWKGGEPGYALSDFITRNGTAEATSLIGAFIGDDTIDVTEQILGTANFGAGNYSDGTFGYVEKLVTLVYVPQKEFAYSPLNLTAATLGYQDAATEMWHTVTRVDGSYNRFEIPEFPLGIGALMSIVALVPVIYVWRTRKKVIKP